MIKKNILITGATSGLGLMLTRFFDKKNYELFITGRDKIKINEIKKNISLANKNNCFAFDFQNNKNLFNFLRVIKKRKKKFDAIIHCLGGGFGKHISLISQKDLNFLFNINVSVGAEINRVIVGNKQYKENLKLIHIASVAGIESTASVGYSMVKSSLISYTKTLSKDLISKNIFVHCVLPGAFEYENNAFGRLKKINRKVYNSFIKNKLPRKKISKAEEFLGLFEFLLTDNSNALAGSSILADFSETNSFRI